MRIRDLLKQFGIPSSAKTFSLNLKTVTNEDVLVANRFLKESLKKAGMLSYL